MAKRGGRLTKRMVESLEKPGRYSDGGCLYLMIDKRGGKSFMSRVVVDGRRRDIGLGGCDITSLEEARERAWTIRKCAREGGDPLADRRKARATPTFAEAARKVHEQNLKTWSNGKHTDQWINTLTTYAFPVIGSMPVDRVAAEHVLRVLSPIWTEKHETARRTLQRLRSVFDWAKAAGHRSGDNPVDGVKLALPKVTADVKHHEALSWRELPAFMAELRRRSGVSALALQFLILTAGRSGEVRGATWDEIDGATWTVPAHRMKMRRPHRVPLVEPAQEILEQLRPLSPTLIFPGQSAGKPLSETSLRNLLKRTGRPELTTHGFRSTFRDWASESAHAPWEVAEACLAHRVGDATERAYARSDLFERRRELMNKWERFCCSSP